MHEVIESGLEQYLIGSPTREFLAHLESCGKCAEQVQGMKAVSSLFATLRADRVSDELEGSGASGSFPQQIPRSGFSARVMARITDEAEQRQAHSIWNFLSVPPAFARRVAFASLMTLAVLGSALAFQGGEYRDVIDSPEAIIAQHDTSSDHSAGSDRALMLSAFASYNAPE